MPRKYPTPDPPRPPPPHPHDRSPADQPARSAPDGTHDGDTHPETTQQQITSNRCPSGVANGSLRQLHFPTSEGILTFTTPSQRAPKPRIWVRRHCRPEVIGARQLPGCAVRYRGGYSPLSIAAMPPVSLVGLSLGHPRGTMTIMESGDPEAEPSASRLWFGFWGHARLARDVSSREMESETVVLEPTTGPVRDHSSAWKPEVEAPDCPRWPRHPAHHGLRPESPAPCRANKHEMRS